MMSWSFATNHCAQLGKRRTHDIGLTHRRKRRLWTDGITDLARQLVWSRIDMAATIQSRRESPQPISSSLVILPIQDSEGGS